MNKQKFNSIVSSPDSVTTHDKDALDELSKTYPYSQIIYSLAAKAHSLKKNEASKVALNTAAMYATDRIVLKELLVIKPKPAPLKKEEAKASENKVEEAAVVKPKHKKITFDTSSFNEGSETLRNNLRDDLEKLKNSKANYLEFIEEADSDISTPPVTAKKPTAKKTSAKTRTAKKTVTATKAVESKKRSTTSNKVSNQKATSTSEKTSTQKKAAAKKTTPKASNAKKTVKKDDKSKSVNEASKKKPKPNQRKASIKEQIHLIDEFIDKKPSISSKPVTSVDDNQKDLSEKSTSFGDDLVSENLALILVDQGKRQKAIEMYKKLIWKFPQKKAYFAAQIEDLSK